MGAQKITLISEQDTRNLANDMAVVAKKGDLITLSGELGAGKTLFARAFIRRYLGMPQLEVPSPTYLMAIEHEGTSGLLVTHMDLFRITNPAEIDELGLEEALERGVVLIEWPIRAEPLLPRERLELSFEITGETTRSLRIDTEGELLERYYRSVEVGKFLRSNWVDNVIRLPFAADASARNYELVKSGDETRILMDAPKAADGPIIKGGLTYSRIAHLAEEVRPFVAIADILRSKGFGAPQIYARDYGDGLVLLEHLGEGEITDSNNQPIARRYVESGTLLAEIHNRNWPGSLVMDDGKVHEILCFDEPAMMIEVQLLSDWYLHDDEEVKIEGDAIDEFNQIWSGYCKRAQSFEQSIVLRDYHSPNIIWRQNQNTSRRIGLIDFQDAMIGPTVYDLASLAQDARVVVSPDLEAQIIAQYLEARLLQNADIDSDKFEFEYAMMATQRATKLLGIFDRLCRRDGKPQYRKLIPQVRKYLKKNLQHPQLGAYREWCEREINL